MAKVEESVQVSVRLERDQVDVLERLAAEAERTLSAEIRRLIRKHVAAASPECLQEAA